MLRRIAAVDAQRTALIHLAQQSLHAIHALRPGLEENLRELRVPGCPASSSTGAGSPFIAIDQVMKTARVQQHRFN